MDNTAANADSKNVTSEPEDEGANTTVETELGDKDSIEPVGDCDYDGGKFEIRHCWLAFRDDHECKYALCMPCYLSKCNKRDRLKSVQGRSSKRKRRTPAEGDVLRTESTKLVCRHELIELELEDKVCMLARGSAAQVGKTIPYKCVGCKKRL